VALRPVPRRAEVARIVREGSTAVQDIETANERSGVPNRPGPWTVTDRTVAAALVLFGAIDMLALGAVVMPFAWMQAAHAWLGLGTMPDAPIVEYLARHTSLWYAAHAATFLYLATDVPRFRPVIRFLGWLGLAFVAVLGFINAASGLPLWWVIQEPVGGSVEAIALLVLLRLSRPTEPLQ
jgi:hypothetical protein